MRTKFLALFLLAASTALAGPRVFVGFGFGGYAYPRYYVAPPPPPPVPYAYAAPYPGYFRPYVYGPRFYSYGYRGGYRGYYRR